VGPGGRGAGRGLTAYAAGVDDVAAGLTDLLLGAVLVGAALWLRALPWVHKYWTLTMWTAGAGAWAGTVHHLVFAGSPRSADLSWVVVGVLVATGISYLLAATAVELLPPRAARWFIRVRIAGLIAYVVVISTTGVGRTLPLVLSESVTMASIVGLWLYALYRRQPRAARMVVAIVGCGLSAVAFAVPEGVSRHLGLDGRSLQHLAQIPGVFLLARAAAVNLTGAPGTPAPATADSADSAGSGGSGGSVGSGGARSAEAGSAGGRRQPGG